MISRVDYKDIIVDIDTICYNTMVFVSVSRFKNERIVPWMLLDKTMDTAQKGRLHLCGINENQAV